jgi:hypothetical protein
MRQDSGMEIGLSGQVARGIDPGSADAIHRERVGPNVTRRAMFSSGADDGPGRLAATPFLMPMGRPARVMGS